MTQTLPPVEAPKTPAYAWELPKAVSDKIIHLLLAAILLMGLGRIAILPPFEGFDETAHYSRLEAVAFAPPGTDIGFITKDVEDYYAHGPMSARWIFARAFNDAYHEALKDPQPLDIRKHLETQKYTDYHAFFAHGDEVKAFPGLYRDKAGAKAFEATKTFNWQFQHPPLYYLAMGPVLDALQDQSLFTRLLTLRSLSYLIAFAGFAIGLFSTRRHLLLTGHPAANSFAVLFAFYPFVMPVWFEEFARLGNDSLCALLFSLTWALMLYHIRRPTEKFAWALLGILMTLSYVTKVLMLPADIGFLLFMALKKPPQPGWTFRFAPPVIAGGIAFIFGYLVTKDAVFSGSIELQSWLHGEGYVQPGAPLPWGGIFYNLETMLTSTIYNFSDMGLFNKGTLAIVAMFLALLAVFIRWIRAIPRNPLREEWLPLYPLLPMLGGLALHGFLGAVAYRAGTQISVTPARYLHVEGAALMVIFGVGLYGFMQQPKGRCFAALLLSAAVVFNAVIIALRLSIYSGCAWISKDFDLEWDDAAGSCGPAGMLDRLGILGWPLPALACLALSLLLLISAIVLTFRRASSGPALSPAEKE